MAILQNCLDTRKGLKEIKTILFLLIACLILTGCEQPYSEYNPVAEVREPSVCSIDEFPQSFVRGEEGRIDPLVIPDLYVVYSSALIESNRKGSLKIWALYYSDDEKDVRVDIPTDGTIVKLDNVCVKVDTKTPTSYEYHSFSREQLNDRLNDSRKERVVNLIFFKELPSGP